jgi:hypothetical protein
MSEAYNGRGAFAMEIRSAIHEAGFWRVRDSDRLRV